MQPAADLVLTAGHTKRNYAHRPSTLATLVRMQQSVHALTLLSTLTSAHWCNGPCMQAVLSTQAKPRPHIPQVALISDTEHCNVNCYRDALSLAHRQSSQSTVMKIGERYCRHRMFSPLPALAFHQQLKLHNNCFPYVSSPVWKGSSRLLSMPSLRNGNSAGYNWACGCARLQ